MPKKVYDIKPPKLTRQTEQATKKSLSENQVQKTRTRRKKEGLNSKLVIFASVSVIVLVFCLYLFFKLPKANISIWPKVEEMSFQQVVVADKSAEIVDISKFLIPAEYFEASKTTSEDFSATGNATNEGKASGIITIYNKYDPVAPLTLKSGTRFMSDTGKLFLASQKIVIPAAKKIGGKITPSSVDVKVEASEGGEAYNIAPSNFSIPGLKGTAYYYSVYGVSDKDMTGGYAGKIKKVTDDDLQNAKDILVKRAEEEAIEELKKQVSQDYVLLENAFSFETVDASTKTKVDSVTESFSYQAEVKAGALAFKKSDIEKFAKDYLISQLQKGSSLLDSSFKVDYSAKIIDVSGGKETLSLDFSADSYKSLDKNSLSLSLLGKNSNQINETIESILGDQVSKVEINFWPFWVKSSPNNQKAVKVELKFE